MSPPVPVPTDLRVLHIGAGKYRPFDREHVTYGIWRELALGFRSYRVIARSTGAPADWTDGNLRVTLVRSWTNREAEFLITQFLAVPTCLRERPNVIVCQSPVAGGLAALFIAYLTDGRILSELHSDIYFDTPKASLKSWIYRQISKLALRGATSIRVLSPGMRKQLQRDYGEPLAKISHVLPPRVNLSLFVRKNSSLRKTTEPLSLIMVGSAVRRKGQLRLIEALADISFPLDLNLVGEGPDLAECQRRAAISASSLNIICHGAVRPDALPALLAQAHVFVMYSDSEGTPRAIMEAMAVGLPVVTTNSGFCSDILEHGSEGFVLGPDPDREIVGVLERLRTDLGLAERMGAAAQARARRDFDSVRLFEEYRRLIAETAQR